MFHGPRHGKAGDGLTWTWLNKLVDLCQRNTINLGIGSGLIMVRTNAGTSLSVAPGTLGAQLAITDGTITARSSVTPGTGTVFYVDYDGTSLNTDTTETVNVLNFSSTTGGIDSSVYVWITQDSSGNWWITSVDCGN